MKKKLIEELLQELSGETNVKELIREIKSTRVLIKADGSTGEMQIMISGKKVNIICLLAGLFIQSDPETMEFIKLALHFYEERGDKLKEIMKKAKTSGSVVAQEENLDALLHKIKVNKKRPN